MYAEVIVDITHEKVDRTFTYRVPEYLERKIRPGMQAVFPFGRGNKEQKGFVLDLTDEVSYDPSRIKSLTGLVSGGFTIEGELIALAAWMKEQYGSTMIQALKTVLPVKEAVKAKEEIYVSLQTSGGALREYLEICARRHYEARRRALVYLQEHGQTERGMLIEQTGITAAALRSMEEAGYVRLRHKSILRIPEGISSEAYGKKELNGQQQAAVKAICEEAAGENRPVLLHGVTGSGKTEVYLERMEQVIGEGKSVIVLIPEIALTYQTMLRFYTRFGERVSFINSRMSFGERYDQFCRAKEGDVQVMIGPRSALFTPFTNLGLIVIDEEHETSYKSELTPRYHARETAIRRASMCGAQVILGSATPSLEAYHMARTGQYRLVKMDSRAGSGTLPEVTVVDMRQELRDGNRSVISRCLHEKIEDRLAKKEQIMVFLNRRGYAGFITCRSCGEVIKCPHCAVSLSVHRRRGLAAAGSGTVPGRVSSGRGNSDISDLDRGSSSSYLTCHYCGHEAPVPEVCPTCGSGYISELKAGTQQIEEVLRREFPGARVLRMDYDTTREKDGHRKVLAAFAAGEADILVGTQMIVKGHDFGNVTLVGALAADMSLNIGDYHGSERTFDLLVQAAGRAGRGDRPGDMVIQSYQPDHYAIELSAAQDYEGFYEQEILFRRMLRYPPCAGMLAIYMTCEDEQHLITAGDYTAKMIRRICRDPKLSIVGPSEGALTKVKDRYRRCIYIKHPEDGVLTDVRIKLEKYIQANEGFSNVYIQFDRNPADLF